MMKNSKDRKWWIFIGSCLMILLVNIDATIVNLALATIAKAFTTSLSEIQWVINSYLLTTMVFFIVGGKLSDIFGRKKIFLIGTVFFGVASLIAGTAPNFITLIIARLLQGIGFAFTLSLALLINAKAFPSSQRGFILGLSTTITGIGQAIGPTVGGAILQEFNWHWIFLINVPITILSFLIILFFLKPQAGQQPEKTLDYFGVLILGFALTALLVTFTFITQNNFNPKLFYVGLGLTVVLLIGFYWKEIKTASPLIDFHLFKRRNYTLSIIIRYILMFTFGNFLFLIPLYLQNILGYSPLFAGLLMLIYSSLFGICSPVSGVWCDQVGYKIPIISSAVMGVVAFVILALISFQSSVYLVMLGLLVFGISAGIMIPSTVNSTISSLPEVSHGEGLGMFFTVAFIGTSMGVAISSVMLSLVSSSHLTTSLQQLTPGLIGNHSTILYRAAQGTLPLVKLKSVFGSQYRFMSQLVEISFIKGLSAVMWLNVVLFVVASILSFTLKRFKNSELNEDFK